MPFTERVKSGTIRLASDQNYFRIQILCVFKKITQLVLVDIAMFLFVIVYIY